MYFKTYQEADQYLGTKQDRPAPTGSPCATRVIRRADGIAVRYQETDVVTYYPDRIVLNSGGWHTSTTKARINEYAPVYVSSTRGVWHIKPAHDDGQVYSDGLAVSWAGEWIKKPDLKAQKRETKRITDLNKKIAKFGEKVKQAVINDTIDRPSGGDCWYCAMTTQTGDTLGETIKDIDHLLEHMRESYIVPSLVYRAVKLHGSYAMYDVLYNRQDSTFNDMREMLAGEIKRSVVKYLRSQFKIGR